MARRSTQVSKAHPAIKKILATITGPGEMPWRGRIVHIDQVDPSWHYMIYNDTGESKVFRIRLPGSMVERVRGPSYGGHAVKLEAPYEGNGEVIATRQIGATGSITLYVPKLDTSIMDVARDALIAGDKKQAAEVLKGLGRYDGIGSAIIDAQKSTLGKAESGKSSRQLDREIAEFLQRDR